MSASYGNQGNWGGASSVGGGGNMSQQEHRGTGGLLGMMGGGLGGLPNMGRSTTAGVAQMQQKQIEEAQLRRMLEEMGIDVDALNGGGAAQQPSSQPSNWAFPQYSQAWLPPPPPVPPMVPTPPFRRK